MSFSLSRGKDENQMASRRTFTHFNPQITQIRFIAQRRQGAEEDKRTGNRKEKTENRIEEIGKKGQEFWDAGIG